MPTVQLKIWDRDATLFDSEHLAGPVPTFFAEDPEAALTGFCGNIEKVSNITKK